mmetsp:Transcript_20477/g.33255  ORF Transcript_20477/g.33255 Transcript_20477/m.33255 type:complete len:242 (-) Transcript_20477:126-851(-)
MDLKTNALLEKIAREFRILEHGIGTMAHTSDELNEFNYKMGTFFVSMSLNSASYNFVKPQAEPLPNMDVLREPKQFDIQQHQLPVECSTIEERKEEVIPAKPEQQDQPVVKSGTKKAKKTSTKTTKSTRTKSKSRGKGKESSRKKLLLDTALYRLRAKLPPKYNNDFEKKRMNRLLEGMQDQDWMALSAVVKGVKHAGFSVFQTKEYLQALHKLGAIEKKKMKTGFGFRMTTLPASRKQLR